MSCSKAVVSCTEDTEGNASATVSGLSPGYPELKWTRERQAMSTSFSQSTQKMHFIEFF
jgi:hypothetical protein